MRETSEDLADLQRRLDESAAAGGEHLRRIFEDARRPSAQELVDVLDGIIEVHLACVTADGAPLVAPIDGIFFRGSWWIGLPSPSLRAKLVRRDPRVSVSYNDRGIAVIVHGMLMDGSLAPDANGEFREIVRELYTKAYGPGWLDWYDNLDHTDDVGGWVEARRIFARRA